MKLVLIVEDEQSFKLALEIAIRGLGFRVMSAADGEEALSMIAESTPDLVLLDIMMPRLGGLETLKIMKSHPQFKKIPVILISGALPLVRQKDFQWNAFLHKPFSIEDLEVEIKKLI